MPVVKNERYREFLDSQKITFMDEKEFNDKLEAIQFKDIPMARAFCIFLYWSGRRPSEILGLKSDDITQSGAKPWLYLVSIATKKGGAHSTLGFTKRNKQLKEFYDYASNKPPAWGLFYKWPNSKSIYKFIQKWFEVSPYFFRHNRLSIMRVKGASMIQLQLWKGAKDQKSVSAYLHVGGLKEIEELTYYQK